MIFRIKETIIEREQELQATKGDVEDLENELNEVNQWNMKLQSKVAR